MIWSRDRAYGTLDDKAEQDADIVAKEMSPEVTEKVEQGTEASNGRKALVLLASLYIHMCSYALPTALGVIYVELIDALDAMRYQAALVMGLCTGGSLAGGVLMGAPMRAYGSGTCVISCALVGGLMMVLSYFATNIFMLIVTVGVVSGLVLGLFFLASFAAVGQVFTTHKKVALSVLTLGASISRMIMPYLTDALLTEYNWNGTLLILGGGILMLNCVPCGVIIWSFERSQESVDNHPATQKHICGFVEFLKDKIFVLFLFAYFVVQIFSFVETYFIVDIAVMKGLGSDFGNFLLSMIGVAGIPGRLYSTLILRLCPNTPAELHLGYSAALVGLSHYLVISSEKTWQQVIGISIRSFSVGIYWGIVPSFFLDIRGQEKFLETVAVSNLVAGAALGLSGYLGGISADLTGDYDVIFYVSTAGTICGGILMVPVYFMRKWKHRQEETASQPYVELD